MTNPIPDKDLYLQEARELVAHMLTQTKNGKHRGVKWLRNLVPPVQESLKWFATEKDKTIIELRKENKALGAGDWFVRLSSHNAELRADLEAERKKAHENNKNWKILREAERKKVAELEKALKNIAQGSIAFRLKGKVAKHINGWVLQGLGDKGKDTKDSLQSSYAHGANISAIIDKMRENPND